MFTTPDQHLFPWETRGTWSSTPLSLSLSIVLFIWIPPLFFLFSPLADFSHFTPASEAFEKCALWDLNRERFQKPVWTLCVEHSSDSITWAATSQTQAHGTCGREAEFKTRETLNVHMCFLKYTVRSYKSQPSSTETWNTLTWSRWNHAWRIWPRRFCRMWKCVIHIHRFLKE